jgi:hypothetical protein
MADDTTTDVEDADAQALASYVHAAAGDAEFVAQCARSARARVAKEIGTATVPTDIAAQAVLEVGANLWARRLNARDQAAPGDTDTTPAFFRPALDPMTPARALLRPWLGVGIA